LSHCEGAKNGLSGFQLAVGGERHSVARCRAGGRRRARAGASGRGARGLQTVGHPRELDCPGSVDVQHVDVHPVWELRGLAPASVAGVKHPVAGSPGPVGRYRHLGTVTGSPVDCALVPAGDTADGGGGVVAVSVAQGAINGESVISPAKDLGMAGLATPGIVMEAGAPPVVVVLAVGGMPPACVQSLIVGSDG